MPMKQQECVHSFTHSLGGGADGGHGGAWGMENVCARKELQGTPSHRPTVKKELEYRGEMDRPRNIG